MHYTLPHRHLHSFPTRRSSDLVYTLIEAKKGGLYRSDDGGTNWALINDDHRFRQRAWYFTHVWADPKDSNKVKYQDRKSTRLNSSHRCISYAVFCLKKKI